jgi:hypothetical protein
MITTCTDCGSLYEAGSEEQANEPKRWCFACRRKRGIPTPAIMLTPDARPEDDEERTWRLRPFY